MPIILNEDARNIWLNIESSTDMLINCFTPYPSDLMERTEAPAPPRKMKLNKSEEGNEELKFDFE